MKNTSIILGALASALLALNACNPAPSTPDVESVAVSPTSLSMTIGDPDVQLSATIKPEGAVADIVWKSTNPSIASVTDKGLVKAVSAGGAMITATAGGKSGGTCRVTVAAPVVPVESVTLDKTTLKFETGDAAVTLKATVLPENATENTVSWSSSNGNVAYVDKNGKVTPYAAGTAVITASAGDKSATCEVTVEKNSSVSGDFVPPEGYTLQETMKFTSDVAGKPWKDIDNFMRTKKFEYTEHCNNTTKEAEHTDGLHALVVFDEDLKQYVLELYSHCNEQVIDGDRGELKDRMRNEMKSQTGSGKYHMNGNWDEWQIIRWKFRIPKGYRPTSSFCHIFQYKAQEGNNGSPLITITLRGSNDGTKRRVQLIHTGDASATNGGTYEDNHPIEDFEDEWVQVQMEAHFTHQGEVNCKIVRISDGKVLIDSHKPGLDMWRTGATNIRNKFGIYRSYGSTLNVDQNPTARPTNGLKDESIRLADFEVYEKNTNPNPTTHD